ncbi:MAG: hypothetical protein ACRCX2_16435 [Paraclostridium sp.]
MGFKKNFTISLVIGSVINSQANIYANENLSKNVLDSKQKEEIVNTNEVSNIEENQKGRSEVEDVVIEWLEDNTTIYTGADIYIEGSALTTGSTIQDVEWSHQDIEGEDVISLNENGNEAIISAISTGKSAIIAAATDGSEKSREIIVNVEDYPTDESYQSLISQNIMPVQSVAGVIQVEASSPFSNKEIEAIDIYLKKLATLGRLSHVSVKSNSMYEFHTIDIDGQSKNTQIEVRVDKLNQSSYTEIVKMLNDLEKYNIDEPPLEPEIPPTQPPVEPPVEPEIPPVEPPLEPEIPPTQPPVEPPIEPEIPPTQPPVEPPVEPEIPPTDSDDSKYIVEEREVTQGIEGIEIIGGFGEFYNPIKIQVDKNLSTENKINVMGNYLSLLKESKDLQVVNIVETEEYSAYKIKVSGKLARFLSRGNKNDFYIEIIVNKNDDSYEPIISMLDDIEKKEGIEVEQEEIKKPTKPNNVEGNKDELHRPQNGNENLDKEKELQNNNKLDISTTIQVQSNTNKKILIDKNNINQLKDKDVQEVVYNNQIQQKSNLKEKVLEENEEITKELEINGVLLATVAGASLGGVTLGGANGRVNLNWLVELLRKKR